MELTVSYDLTPKERWQAANSVSPGSALDSFVRAAAGLSAAALGIGLVVWRVKPGAASGWAVIVTGAALIILGGPHVAVIHYWSRVMLRPAAGHSAPMTITVTDASLKWERSGCTTELPWQNVTTVRMSADCWLICKQETRTAVVLPRRVVPSGTLPELDKFLTQHPAMLRRLAANGRG